ncbi:unnamed protein product [Mytilus coruscus]|uniref:Uncharacterized protein n=1 Tax=Mytilus coruscus TaxID=42192 RepID=A0A6J8AE28_MYTCO|nr:unnamed protein product [Mytilus coruscus]
MASRIHMQVYEDTILYKDEHTYEPIKTVNMVKKDNNVIRTWKQWFIIFILMLVVSLMFSGIGLIVTYFTLHSNLERKIEQLEGRITELEELLYVSPEQYNVTRLSQKVGFTSCGGEIASGSRIKFTSLTSSHGINVASSYREGKFSPKKAGFYLVLSNILSSSQDGYYIRKNGIEIARAWSHFSDSSRTPRYSAPLSAFIQLSVYDVITIEGTSADFSSCLTIVQL